MKGHRVFLAVLLMGIASVQASESIYDEGKTKYSGFPAGSRVTSIQKLVFKVEPWENDSQSVLQPNNIKVQLAWPVTTKEGGWNLKVLQEYSSSQSGEKSQEFSLDPSWDYVNDFDNDDNPLETFEPSGERVFVSDGHVLVIQRGVNPSIQYSVLFEDLMKHQKNGVAHFISDKNGKCSLISYVNENLEK